VKEKETSNKDVECEDNWEQERAFEVADCLEKGNARESSTEFLQPLRRSSKLWRFFMVRSEDRTEYRLHTIDGEFLMFAKASVENRRVDFFLYNPSKNYDQLLDLNRPPFTMTYNGAKTEWCLLHNRCECCQFSPKNVSCARVGSQQVAFIRHTRESVGGGISYCLHVRIPGFDQDGLRLVWCPMSFGCNLAEAHESSEVRELVSKMPTWNSELQSLVLDFKDRAVDTSAKNFQLVQRKRPDNLVCQFAKQGPRTFLLDFAYPLSIVQAFGVALSTVFWT